MVAVCDRGKLVDNVGEVVGRIGVGVDVVGDFVQFGKNMFGAVACGSGEVGDSFFGTEGMAGLGSESINRFGGEGLRFIGIDGIGDCEFGVSPFRPPSHFQGLDSNSGLSEPGVWVVVVPSEGEGREIVPIVGELGGKVPEEGGEAR